jgi:hypothetical protein
MTVFFDQLQMLAEAWGNDPTLVYDTGFLVRALNQLGFKESNPTANPEDFIRDAANEGYLYVDQIQGGKVFFGMTDSARIAWHSVYPELADQYPVYGGRVPPIRPV